MADLSVTPESLHSAAAELRSESQHIDAVLASLEQEIGRLRAQWDGQSQEAYDRAQRQWSVTFGEMKNLLARIAVATDAIADDYVDSDHRSAKLFTHGADGAPSSAA